MSDKTSKNEDIEAEHSEATETESEYESTDNDTEDEHATGEASEKKKKKKKVCAQSIPHRSPAESGTFTSGLRIAEKEEEVWKLCR